MEHVTIKKVAEHLGVAASSVSRVLNDHPDVSDDMRRRVQEAADELGYQPDYLAQSLRRGATKSVGFLLRDLSNPIFADIVKGAETRLRAEGYSLLLTNSEGDPSLDAKNVSVLRGRRVDGLILSLQSETEHAVVQNLQTLDLPIVLVDHEVQGVEASIVRCDHRTGVRSAVGHLLQLGHRRIAFFSGPDDILATRERMQGFRDAFSAVNLTPDLSLVKRSSYERSFGYDQTLQLLSLDDPPTAVLAAGVQSTTGVVAAVHHLGLRIGRDLALVSCDDVELMQYLDPPISVVHRDSALIGRLAAELLLERLTEGGSARDTLVPTEYVPRGSSSALSD